MTQRRSTGHRMVVVLSLLVLMFPATAWAGDNTFPANGDVGIGTLSPSAPLHVLDAGAGVLRIFNLQRDGFKNMIYVNTDDTGAGVFNFTDGNSTKIQFSTISGQNSFILTGKFGVGISTPTSKLHVVGDARVTGNMVVDGNIAAKYQDVAEWVPTSDALEPGTVVVIDSEYTNHVEASGVAYDTRVAGVVSEQPGLILGEAADGSAKVANFGRVPVRVDATFGPIAVGDLLVTSPRPGHAMRSEPVDVGGVPIHRPGTLLGKALEPLTEGEGTILVLLTLQ